MPYRKVQFARGSYYHIYNRGAGRHSIFYEDKNYLYLLDLLKRAVKRLNITVIAYCLMPNHYHWLVRQDGETPAGMLAKRVFGSYTQAFNHAYHRSGTLFEGPYQAILVESDDYLHHLCRYIHANPVRHGVALAPELWTYSNYLEWIGERAGTLVDHEFIAAHFPLPGQYQAYVRSYLTGEAHLPEGLRTYLDEL